MIIFNLLIVDNNFKGDENQKFSKMLILCVAYASSIGGMMTPIGTIPNAVMIGFLAENFNLEISFIEWVIFISPLSVALLFMLWLYLSFGISHKTERINQKKLKLKVLLFYFSFFFLNISKNIKLIIPIEINISATLKTNQL